MKWIFCLLLLFLCTQLGTCRTVEDVYRIVEPILSYVRRMDNPIRDNNKKLMNLEARLVRMEETLVGLGKILNKQHLVLNRQDKTLELLNEELSEQKKILNNQSSTLKSLDERLLKHAAPMNKTKRVLKPPEIRLKNQSETVSSLKVLKIQTLLLKKQGLTLNQQQMALRDQSNALRSLSGNLKSQKVMLRNQEKILNKHGTSLKHQSSILKTIHGHLKSQNLTLYKHGSSLNQQGRVLKNQSDILKNLDAVLENHQATLKKQGEILNQQAGGMLISADVSSLVIPGKTASSPAESCLWLNKAFHNLKSGKYWLKKMGKPSFEYCEMDEAGISPKGSSCKDIKKQYPGLESGTYTIEAGGKIFETVCDMETDGGGWMMVSNVIVRSNIEAAAVDYETIQADDYMQLEQVTTGRFVLSTKGLSLLHKVVNFTEIRIDCRKHYHGRRLNLKTEGNDVLQWLLHQRNSDPKPNSWNTFRTLDGDNSNIGLACKGWCYGTWSDNNLYDNPIGTYDTLNSRYDYISLAYNRWHGLLCDDDNGRFDNRGTWTYYVR